MRLTANEYRKILELIELLYGLSDPSVKFRELCDQLQKLVPFKSAAYAPAEQNSPIVFPGAIVYQAPMRPLFLFSEYYYKFHPYFDAIRRNGLEKYRNKATNLTDLAPPSRLRNGEYHDFLSLADVSYEICVSLGAQGDSVGLLGFHREAGSRDFNRRELTIMSLIVPHIARSLHLSGLVSRTLSPSTAEFVMGSDGELRSLNREAKRILKGVSPAIIPVPKLHDGATFISTCSGIYRVRTVKDLRQQSLRAQLDPEPSPLNLQKRFDGFGLTERQKEVAVGAIRGLSNHEIAEQLCICEQTVKDHLHDIFAIMRIRKRSELAVKLFLTSQIEKHS